MGMSQTCYGARRGFVREAAERVRGMRETHQLALVASNTGLAERPIRAEIATVFEQVLGHPVQISDRTDIVEDLGLDSLGVMNFVMAIEDFYDISIPLDRIAQVQTVGDLIHAVEQLRSGAPA
jgi:acyl carrier protein